MNDVTIFKAEHSALMAIALAATNVRHPALFDMDGYGKRRLEQELDRLGEIHSFFAKKDPK